MYLLAFIFEQLRKSSVTLKTINTSQSFKSLWSHYIILWLLWGIQRLTTVCLFYCRDSLHNFKRIYKSVSIRKSNLKFSTVTSTKDRHRIPKNEKSVTESLNLVPSFQIMRRKTRNFGTTCSSDFRWV